MALSPRETVGVGAWLDRLITGLYLGVLAWVVWNLGGVMARPMGAGFAGAMAVVVLVWLRWLVLDATGLPRGWWWPLPMLAYAGLHVGGLSATPGRAVMDALLGVWGVAGWWGALHLVRFKETRRWLWLGVGLITVVMGLLAFYQRAVDPTWLPLDRIQSKQYQERSSGPFGVPNNMAAWMLMVLPPAWWLTWRCLRKRPEAALTAGVVAVLASAALVLSLSRGVWLAAFLALAVWATVGRSGGWGRRFGLGVAVLVVAGGLVAWSYAKLPVVRDRMDIMVEYRGERTRPMMWSAAWQTWQDSPWTGSGGGSFEAVLEKHRPAPFRDAPKWVHNDYLNVLSDYGVVGFGLSWGLAAVVLAGTAWRHSRRRVAQADGGERVAFDDGWRTAVGVGLLGLLLASVVDFHFHIPAVVWLAALAAAEWTGGRRRGDAVPRATVRTSRVRRIGAAAVGLVAVVLAVLAWPRYVAEQHRFLGRELTDKLADRGGAPSEEDLAAILVHFEAATRLAPEHELGWAELSMAIALQAHVEPERKVELGREAEVAARRALALSEAVAWHWVRLGVALDLQGEWAEGGLAFGRAVKLAPTNARVWFYQGFHFSQKAHTHALARVALATCLRLDGGIRQAKALRADLERSP
ncbi:O-antigen ligase family protein [Actomonas aquatica]|uniref:O-antigen ligase family protein n=1 Tax=Actomonas aquatica TaxID=2866162 RepID=A0ABZ1C888_9BACT|nr:O-antigen ligase family protein [Opitutus sp. WL0086]WRQ87488.1 O-antigen ligase family protein [Opitutus sp. WL0086]